MGPQIAKAIPGGVIIAFASSERSEIDCPQLKTMGAFEPKIWKSDASKIPYAFMPRTISENIFNEMSFFLI